MATFAKSNFGFSSYASFRPTYPKSLYQTVLGYHQGYFKQAIDLGCGHGIVARGLSPSFTRVSGVDPSAGMIAKAKALSRGPEHANVSFHAGSALDLGVPDESVDVIMVGQAAHWFPYPAAFTVFHKALRPGGMIALFGYKDPIFPQYPRASQILDDYAYADDKMGPYWTQPGRSIVQNKLRDIQPPTSSSQEGGQESLWTDVQRIEYEPGTAGPQSGEGTMFMSKTMTPAELASYTRTWSSYHGWMEAHPDRQPREEGDTEGQGDIVDAMMDEILKVEEAWRDPDTQVLLEWGSGLLLARAV